MPCKLGQSASQQSGTQEPVVNPGFTRDQAVGIVKKHVDPKLQPHLFLLKQQCENLLITMDLAIKKKFGG